MSAELQHAAALLERLEAAERNDDLDAAREALAQLPPGDELGSEVSFVFDTHGLPAAIAHVHARVESLKLGRRFRWKMWVLIPAVVLLPLLLIFSTMTDLFGPPSARVVRPSAACASSLHEALSTIVRGGNLSTQATEAHARTLMSTSTLSMEGQRDDASFTYAFRLVLDEGACQVRLYRIGRRVPGKTTYTPHEITAPAPGCTCR